MKHPAAGGGHWVEVPPERLVSWIVTFSHRHTHPNPTSPASPTSPTSPASPTGPVGLVAFGDAQRQLTFTAADGATAECHPPFPGTPMPPNAAGPQSSAADPQSSAAAMAAYAAADRTVGVLLVRLGGYAVGVFAGTPPELLSSKTGSRLVHGRSAAGGWSQHRFARRRENQATAALRAAADAAATVFGPYGAAGLDAVVLGGDKRSADGLRGDVRLAPYLDRAVDRFLTVPDPRLAVLKEAPRAFSAIRIRLTEPEPNGSPRPDQVN